MANISLGAGTKQFYRVLSADASYAPDATTVGTRVAAAAGDSIINTQLSNVNQGATPGEGFLVPPGQEFGVRFIGWTNAVCVIQEYNPFTAAWETIYTFTAPLVHQMVRLDTPNPIRIGAFTVGSDGATLKVLITFNQSDRVGF